MKRKPSSSDSTESLFSPLSYGISDLPLYWRKKILCRAWLRFKVQIAENVPNNSIKKKLLEKRQAVAETLFVAKPHSSRRLSSLPPVVKIECHALCPLFL